MDAPTSVPGITLGCRGSEVAVRVVSMTGVAATLPQRHVGIYPFTKIT